MGTPSDTERPDEAAAELLNCLPGQPVTPIPGAAGAPSRPAPLEPLAVPTARVVELGIAAWLVVLAATLVVPALHSGDRSWWPWAAVSGVALGLLGWAYVRRGRGNAADAG